MDELLNTETEKTEQQQQGVKLAPQNYTGTYCPVCESTNLSPDDQHTFIDDSTLATSVGCNNCGSVWEEIHKLQSYRNLEIGAHNDK